MGTGITTIITIMVTTVTTMVTIDIITIIHGIDTEKPRRKWKHRSSEVMWQAGRKGRKKHLSVVVGVFVSVVKTPSLQGVVIIMAWSILYIKFTLFKHWDGIWYPC